MQNKNVAIIGGGFTGLTAAYRLSKLGYKVTILEKSSDIGGLAGGFTIQGASLEKAYHHIFKTDKDIIDLAKELGISDKILWLKSIPANCYKGKIYSFGTPISLLKFKPFPFIDRVRTGVISLYLQKTNNWKKFEKVSAYNWVKKWYGNTVTRIFFEPLLKGKFDSYYDKVSMAWLWARIHTRLQSRVKGVSEEVLGYFDGGFSIITDALKKEFAKSNVSIITQANVQSLFNRGSNVIIKYNNIEQSFDKVIATVPSHVFSTLIEMNNTVDKSYLSSLKSIDYLGAVVMIFSSNQKLGTHYWHTINDLSFPFLVFINHTNLVDKAKYNNKYIYYVAAYVPHNHKYFKNSDEALYTEWFFYIKKLFPAFKDTEILDKYIFKFKYAQHIVDLDYKSKIPAYKTVLRNVYLANFSQIFPEDRGTNFAVKEGNKIAKLLDEDFNKSFITK